MNFDSFNVHGSNGKAADHILTTNYRSKGEIMGTVFGAALTEIFDYLLELSNADEILTHEQLP